MNNPRNRNLSGPNAIEDQIAAERKTSKPFAKLAAFSSSHGIFSQHPEGSVQTIVQRDRPIDLISGYKDKDLVNILSRFSGKRVTSHYLASFS